MAPQLPQCTVTGPSGEILHWGFVNDIFATLATQVQVSLQASAGWLPLHRGFSKGRTDCLPTYLNICESAEDWYSL